MHTDTCLSPRVAEEHARERADLHALRVAIARRIEADRERIDACLAAVAPPAGPLLQGRAQA